MTPEHSFALHSFFRQLSFNREYACMLGGNTHWGKLNQWIIAGIDARQVVQLNNRQLRINGNITSLHAASPSEVLFSALDTVQKNCDSWKDDSETLKLPFSGGLITLLGYQFYQWTDPVWHLSQAVYPETLTGGSIPDQLLAIEFEHWLLMDLSQLEPDWLILSRDDKFKHHVNDLWQATLSASAIQTPSCTMPIVLQEAPGSYFDGFNPSMSQAQFERSVEQIQHHITMGELYQANLSMAFKKTVELDPWKVFEQLCLSNPSPFSAFLKWPSGVLISNSPECLIKLDKTGLMQTRPIAGTRGRGKTAEEDTAIGNRLLNNAKERAEHLMLVDLARNDLGKIAVPGTVTVDELLVLERYSHVTHLVSHVIAQQNPGASLWDVLQAIFPCGTITGCPKIRCLDILETLEQEDRGFYTGSLGYMGSEGKNMAFNILIRSLFLKPLPNTVNTFEVCFNTGAGIVDGAVASYEYQECLKKGSAILRVLYNCEHPGAEAVNLTL